VPVATAVNVAGAGTISNVVKLTVAVAVWPVALVAVIFCYQRHYFCQQWRYDYQLYSSPYTTSWLEY
jgi:hypothetical protein